MHTFFLPLSLELLKHNKQVILGILEDETCNFYVTPFTQIISN